jgi:hypothetical protein
MQNSTIRYQNLDKGKVFEKKLRQTFLKYYFVFLKHFFKRNSFCILKILFDTVSLIVLKKVCEHILHNTVYHYRI